MYSSTLVEVVLVVVATVVQVLVLVKNSNFLILMVIVVIVKRTCRKIIMTGSAGGMVLRGWRCEARTKRTTWPLKMKIGSCCWTGGRPAVENHCSLLLAPGCGRPRAASAGCSSRSLSPTAQQPATPHHQLGVRSGAVVVVVVVVRCYLVGLSRSS